MSLFLADDKRSSVDELCEEKQEPMLGENAETKMKRVEMIECMRVLC